MGLFWKKENPAEKFRQRRRRVELKGDSRRSKGTPEADSGLGSFKSLDDHPVPPNYRTYEVLQRLRGRSRNLTQHTPIAAQFVRAFLSGVLGPKPPKLALEPQPDGADALVRQRWERWTRSKSADWLRERSWYFLLSQIVYSWAVDGESFVRKRPGRPLSIEVIDSERVPSHLVGSYSNGATQTGSSAKNRYGFDLDKDGRRTGVHIARPTDTALGHFSSYYNNYSTGNLEVVRFSEVCHLMEPVLPGQLRGLPMLTPAMTQLSTVDQAQGAAMKNFELHTKHFATISQGAVENYFGTDPNPEEDLAGMVDEDGEPVQVQDTIELGKFDTTDALIAPVVPEGYKMEPFNGGGKFPDSAYGPFMAAALKSVAAGVGVSYPTLTSDLAGVSYSAARIGVIAEQINFAKLRMILEESVITPIFLTWLARTLKANETPLTEDDFDRLANPEWQFFKPPAVDEGKQASAAKTRIEAGISSRRSEIIARGDDPDRIFEQQEDEPAVQSDAPEADNPDEEEGTEQ